MLDALPGTLDETARWRRAEMIVGLLWYVFSLNVLWGMTVSSSALSALPGLDAWSAVVGRFAVLPALGVLGGLAFLLRHQWRARAEIDRLVGGPIDRREPLLVFGSTTIVATLAWIARPALDPVAFCIAILLFCTPLVWVGVRASSRSTRWVWLVTAFGVVAAATLAAIEIRYGPLQGASDDALFSIVAGVLGLAGVGLVLTFGLLGVVLFGFLQAERAWNRGDLEGVARISYGGLLEDSPQVLEALRLLERGDEVEERYHRLAAALPLTGPVHVLAQLLTDRDDPRAAPVARAGIDAFPLSPASLLAFARVVRRSHPEEAVDALRAAETRGFGGSSRAPVVLALEACSLAHLGQHGAARKQLSELDPGDHPIHAAEARLYAAEAWEVLGDPDRAASLRSEVTGVPSFVRRAAERAL